MGPIHPDVLLSQILVTIQNEEPLNAKQIESAVNLLQNRAWVEGHQDQVLPICKYLDSSDLPESIKSVYIGTLEKNPRLFSRIQITMGDQKVTLPIATWSARSEKFRQMLQPGMKESQADVIHLVTIGIEPHIIRDFLDYLSTGNVELTGDNVLPLLSLAEEHGVHRLRADCVTLLENNLNFETFESIFSIALELKLDNLTWICIEFHRTNKEKLELQEIVNKPELTPVVKKFLDLVNRGATHGIFLELMIVGHVIIRRHDSYQEKGLEIIKQLHEKVGIRGIQAGEFPLTNEDLEKLSNILPNLNSLYIESNLITVIPPTWQKSLKALRCPDCKLLKIIDLPEAEFLNCQYCTSATIIRAPKAKSFYADSCTSVKILEAPEAESFSSNYCTAATTLRAPKARYVHCDGCTAATVIEALGKETFSLKECNWRVVEAKEAEEMFNCDHSNLATTIRAPKAKKVSCDGCVSATLIEANEAETVYCMECTSLRKIVAPKAKVIYCRGCPEDMEIIAGADCVIHWN